jgi:hypothetical protein
VGAVAHTIFYDLSSGKAAIPMARISNRQCRQARSLLKWNPQDLACRTHITARRIEGFERGSVRLMLPEQKELVDIFEKAGLVFTGENDVAFSKRFNAEVSGTGMHQARPKSSNSTSVDQIVRVDVSDEVLRQAEEERKRQEEHNALRKNQNKTM